LHALAVDAVAAWLFRTTIPASRKTALQMQFVDRRIKADVGAGDRPGAIDAERARFSTHLPRTPNFARPLDHRPRSGELIAGLLPRNPFQPSLANLGIKLRRLALVLLLAIHQSARAARKGSHVSYLLLPAIDLFGERRAASPARHVRLAQRLQASGLECASNFLREWSYPYSIG